MELKDLSQVPYVESGEAQRPPPVSHAVSAAAVLGIVLSLGVTAAGAYPLVDILFESSTTSIEDAEAIFFATPLCFYAVVVGGIFWFAVRGLKLRGVAPNLRAVVDVSEVCMEWWGGDRVCSKAVVLVCLMLPVIVCHCLCVSLSFSPSSLMFCLRFDTSQHPPPSSTGRTKASSFWCPPAWPCRGC